MRFWTISMVFVLLAVACSEEPEVVVVESDGPTTTVYVLVGGSDGEQVPVEVPSEPGDECRRDGDCIGHWEEEDSCAVPMCGNGYCFRAPLCPTGSTCVEYDTTMACVYTKCDYAPYASLCNIDDENLGVCDVHATCAPMECKGDLACQTGDPCVEAQCFHGMCVYEPVPNCSAPYECTNDQQCAVNSEPYCEAGDLHTPYGYCMEGYCMYDTAFENCLNGCYQGECLGALVPGDVFTSEEDPMWYYYGDDYVRYPFANIDVYDTWYPYGGPVKTIVNKDMGMIPLGPVIVTRPGTYLVKISSSPNVYSVGKCNALYRIVSEAAAVAHFGVGWGNWIIEVPDIFWPYYNNYGYELTELSASVHGFPPGQVVHDLISDGVFFKNDGDASWSPFTSQYAFDVNRINYDFVATVIFDEPINLGPEITGYEPRVADPSYSFHHCP